MAEFPEELRYLETHEWVRDEGDGTVTVGISDHAQEALGDVVYVELPELESAVTAGGEVAVVESVKAASDVYSPCEGLVIAVNEALEDAPELVNESPYADGWFFKVRVGGELPDLLSAGDYKTQCESEEH